VRDLRPQGVLVLRAQHGVLGRLGTVTTSHDVRDRLVRNVPGCAGLGGKQFGTGRVVAEQAGDDRRRGLDEQLSDSDLDCPASPAGARCEGPAAAPITQSRVRI
jgi:hypothetical protein